MKLRLRIRACLKKAFCKICVTICGRFCPDEGVVAGYDNRIRDKSPAKWGVQIAGMIFQTGSSITHYIRACTGFDGGFEVVEAIRSLPNCVITGNSKYKR